MRLRVSRASGRERLISLLNRGYELKNSLESDYQTRVTAGIFDSHADLPRYEAEFDAWINGEVRAGLREIFPTQLEWETIRNMRQLEMVFVGVDQLYGRLLYRLSGFIKELRSVLNESLDQYTDLPESSRLYVEDIESFAAVRDVNPQMVAPLLSTSGYLDISEESVQTALESIIGETFHKKDWGGETNDLYSSQIVVAGRRVASAFLLKGNGLKKSVMQLRDCGKNGDQVVRLFTAPALLFVVQFVGNVAENVIADVEGKVNEARLRGNNVHYLIMNGLDTARLLVAYGKLRVN